MGLFNWTIGLLIFFSLVMTVFAGIEIVGTLKQIRLTWREGRNDLHDWRRRHAVPRRGMGQLLDRDTQQPAYKNRATIERLISHFEKQGGETEHDQ